MWIKTCSEIVLRVRLEQVWETSKRRFKVGGWRDICFESRNIRARRQHTIHIAELIVNNAEDFDSFGN